MDMLNAVKSVLADVSSVSPPSKQRALILEFSYTSSSLSLNRFVLFRYLIDIQAHVSFHYVVES